MAMVINDITMNDEYVKDTITKESPLNFQAAASTDTKVIKTCFYGLRKMPEDIDPKTKPGLVFYNLLQCFMLNDTVEESSIKNVMYGFSVSGINASDTMDGFMELYSKHYIDLVTPYGVAILGTANEHSWFKLTPKFLALLANNSGQALGSENNPKSSPIQSRHKYSRAQLLIDELAEQTHTDTTVDAVDVGSLNKVFA